MTIEPLILASQSPRRRRLLRCLPIPFAVMKSDAEETVGPDERPAQVAKRLALQKAETVAGTLHRGVVIGADTLVAVDGTILGKPGNAADANRMLRLLRGRSHQVTTGLALVQVNTGRREVRKVVTTVHCGNSTDRELERYAATGRSLDKAGGYAVQDRELNLVEAVDGCYNNVVGLPLCELTAMLADFGLLKQPLLICRKPDRSLCPRLRTDRREPSRVKKNSQRE